MKISRLQNFKYGELYCGPGGMSLGAKKAFVRKNGKRYRLIHAWANDIDEDSCKTFRNNICPNKPKLVYDLPVDEFLTDNILSKLEKIDAFGYGFPCNDFSIVGEHKGMHGSHGALYTYGVKVLDYFKPRFFIAENVGGISSANAGGAFKKICDDLEKAGKGYVLTKHKYKAEFYKVPQKRHRIIIVGIDQRYGLKFKVPAPLISEKDWITASEAIGDGTIPKNAPNNEEWPMSNNVKRRLQKIKPWENAWNATLPPDLRLNVKSAKLSQIYRKLHPDLPSYTLTASGGGGTHGYHYEEHRPLTNRERAKLQTFPNDYKFEGKNLSSVRKQIGMAVPPQLAKVIFVAVLKTFNGIDYPSVSSNLEKETLDLK
jgi:DNA (cytosine-5)-methyltransferase 1